MVATKLGQPISVVSISGGRSYIRATSVQGDNDWLLHLRRYDGKADVGPNSFSKPH